MADDPDLEPIARSMCRADGTDPERWQTKTAMARAWLRNYRSALPANDPAPRRIPIVFEVIGEEAFPL
jgi:hypothetical protein